MRAIVFCAVLLCSAFALTCPSQYQLMGGKCIRPLALQQSFKVFDKIQAFRDECAKDGAHLPIIKGSVENDDFHDIAESFDEIRGDNILLVLDTTCDSEKNQLEWIDGSTIDFTPEPVDFDIYNCLYDPKTAIFVVIKSVWIFQSSYDDDWKTVLCVIDEYTVTTTIPTTTLTTAVPQSEQCREYLFITNPTDGAKPCFKVHNELESWEMAQLKCAAEFASLVTITSAEENNFFWRTAISNNILEGMHIGAHQSSEDPEWTWIDGEFPFGGKTYDNFISYFPVPGVGNCSSMLTDSSTAYWINEDCQENAQPFICRRSDFGSIPKTCPTEAPTAGEDIFPPGFPNPETACDYFLFASAKKLVELQVLTLVAEPNMDYLEILEGTSGPHLIANLTGSIFTTTKFITTESNVMRVNWRTSATSDNRGFRIRFNEVDS